MKSSYPAKVQAVRPLALSMTRYSWWMFIIENKFLYSSVNQALWGIIIPVIKFDFPEGPCMRFSISHILVPVWIEILSQN